MDIHGSILYVKEDHHSESDIFYCYLMSVGTSGCLTVTKRCKGVVPTTGVFIESDVLIAYLWMDNSVKCKSTIPLFHLLLDRAAATKSECFTTFKPTIVLCADQKTIDDETVFGDSFPFQCGLEGNWMIVTPNWMTSFISTSWQIEWNFGGSLEQT